MREKYGGDRDAKGVAVDTARLQAGEPLAYVIGNIPFLGLIIHLDSRPLIPRPETEWWTELLIERIKEILIYHNDSMPIPVLDLCAGSGTVGLAVLKHCPSAQVSFGELIPEHAHTIQKNIERNALDASHAEIRTGNLFEPYAKKKFDLIASNPPYIPEARALDAGVTAYEPREALFGGEDGLNVIRKIIKEAPSHLNEGGELWVECDVENIKEAKALAARVFTRADIRTDQYGRERLLVAHL